MFYLPPNIAVRSPGLITPRTKIKLNINKLQVKLLFTIFLEKRHIYRCL